MIFTVTKWKSRKNEFWRHRYNIHQKLMRMEPHPASATAIAARKQHLRCGTKKGIGLSWYYRVISSPASDSLGYGQCKATSAAAVGCWAVQESLSEVGCEASIPSCWLEWLEMQLHGNYLRGLTRIICHHLPHGRPICWRTLSRHQSSGMAMTAKQLHCDPCHSYTHSTSIGGAGFNLDTQKHPKTICVDTINLGKL